jgi:hypothetical protein
VVAVPEWLVVGLAIAGGLAVLFAGLFAAGERFFPAAPAEPRRANAGEWKRRAEIRAYLDAIGEGYAEDYRVAGAPVAFYLPSRDVAITFDGQRYFEIERAGTHAVLVEHEMPGGHLGARLPFETPDVGFDAGPDGDGGERAAGAGGRLGNVSERRDAAAAFETLGVAPDADSEEIRAAYREQVKEVHPDHGGEAEAFRELQEAYTAAREAAS